jgi:hypothetical protein
VTHQRRLGAPDQPDAADVVQRRRDCPARRRDVEQLLRQLQVEHGLLVGPQRAGGARGARGAPPFAGRSSRHARAQRLAEVRERLLRAAQPRRQVAQRVEGVHLGDGVVEIEEAHGRAVQHVGAVSRWRSAPRRPPWRSNGRADGRRRPRTGAQRLEPLLASVAGAALEPLRGEQAPLPRALGRHARLDQRLLQRVLEAPGGLAGEHRVGTARCDRVGEPLEDLADLGDGRIGREHVGRVRGCATQAPQRHDTACPEDAAEDGPARRTSRSAA